MSAVVTPAFAHKLPPAKPTLMQLGLAALAAGKAASDHLMAADDRPSAEADERRQGELDDAAFDARAAFFAALESETGIDRRLFAKLGDLA